MAQPVHPRQAAALRGCWLWLFPASYALHIAEEGLAGERFYRWISRVTGREVSPGVFAGVNLAYEVAMVVVVRRALTREDAAWVVPALGTITAVNGIGHLAGSVVTHSYSPGAVSGVGVWAPLGLFALVRSRRLLPRPVWRRGIMAGALVLGSVGLLALPLSRKSPETMSGTRPGTGQ
ncbi:MAG TPA: HXXEE domain-containing protein [Streptosporangiaceae bacterium]|nr:HXXEE domain-containing protein [Streptosporangiaceae bacterium]